MRKQPVTLVSDSLRAELARDPGIGAGNFLNYALKASPSPDAVVLHLEKPLRSFENRQALSLLDLDRLANSYAAWYADRGVGPQDPVAVYLDDGVEYLIHYLALTRIGAIGVLTNGNMPPAIAAAHAHNVGAVGIITDESHMAEMQPFVKEKGLRFFVTEESIELPAGRAATAYRHVNDDPIMIAHSSGTTGIPKAVLLQHDRFFYGIRYRLGVPRVPGGEYILSSLPHSHNCAIAYIMLALLSGTPVYVASNHTGAAVLRQIEDFRPGMVVSFPQTYVEMTECDMSSFDLSSVSLWFNGGDAAHESHIRALIRHGSHEMNGIRQEGSIFIDGMGSSEMGFSLFRNVHTLKTNQYDRCVGRPLDWVDAQILSDSGELLGPGQVGKLGVKAPSVTSGYWNNSLLTYRSRLSGYFLTGDLAYKDESGRFFHVDRTSDLIVTADGPVYGLQTEEFLLSRFPAIADCTVFARQRNGEHHATAVGLLRIRPASELSGLSAIALKDRCNKFLAAAGLPVLGEVMVTTPANIPLGTTGKVLKRLLRTETVSNA
jgi:acyl-coenzyme A synthetase/AMP-(fatty) acid ligase